MRKRYLVVAGAALSAALWCVVVLLTWRNRGLFDWLGLDFALFRAGAAALLASGPVAAYDLDAVTAHLQPLAAYYGPLADVLKVGPVPYPPIFVLLVAPFALLSPPVGFLLWTLANLALALVVVRGLAARFPARPRMLVGTALLFFPLAYTLFVGQVTILLLFALYQAYRAFEQDRDFRAGLWTGVLLLKPQYAVVLLLVLALKGRWSALYGATLAGVALLLSSLAMLGPDGLLTYLASLRYVSGFRSVHPLVYPEAMASWRGLLVNLLPGVSDAQGVLLTLVLSALTLGALLAIWRGRWDAHDERFPARFLALVAATMLVAFHNHVHGATLLVVPGMVLLAQGGGSRLLRRVIELAVYAPVPIFYFTGSMALVASLFVALMLVALAAVFVAEVFPVGRPVPATHRPLVPQPGG
ncbi:MAG: DUF2029 domain-containing protein [Chloroflexi bacterium]|nr:DUF2029 domain-containing protein [Chloroflexota bacterium]